MPAKKKKKKPAIVENKPLASETAFKRLVSSLVKETIEERIEDEGEDVKFSKNDRDALAETAMIFETPIMLLLINLIESELDMLLLDEDEDDEDDEDDDDDDDDEVIDAEYEEAA